MLYMHLAVAAFLLVVGALGTIGLFVLMTLD